MKSANRDKEWSNFASLYAYGQAVVSETQTRLTAKRLRLLTRVALTISDGWWSLVVAATVSGRMVIF